MRIPTDAMIMLNDPVIDDRCALFRKQCLVSKIGLLVQVIGEEWTVLLCRPGNSNCLRIEIQTETQERNFRDIAVYRDVHMRSRADEFRTHSLDG